MLNVLDGWHFPLLAFLQNNNIYSERMRPVIIVNISHGDRDYMSLRARDFTPTKTSENANSGGAAAFLDFLEHELIPFIDRTYRTNPDDRALFQRIVAASPALHWDGRLLLTAAKERLQKLPAPVRFNLSAGDEKDDTASVTAVAKLLDERKPANLDYRFTLYRGENHNSVRLASFPAGLYWVYRPAKK